MRGMICKWGLIGAGGCRGGAEYGIEGSQSFLSLLRVTCLPRRRRGISFSDTLQSRSFIALQESIWCGVVIRGGNPELVGLGRVEYMHLLATLGKLTAFVHIRRSSPK